MLGHDIRYAARTLRRNPGFTAVAVLMLAVGIAANAAVFAVTNAVLFKGFRSVDGNNRILYIGTQNNGRGCCVSYPDYMDWRAEARSFVGLAAVADLQVVGGDAMTAPERYDATEISANGFRLLGQRPMLGRDFDAADEAPGAAPVAILRYSFWETHYGKDPGVVGRTVRVNGTPTTIVGVMPQNFSFPQNQDFWLPLVPTPDRQRREARVLWFAFGRMAKGATIESARAELATIGQRLGRAYPRTNDGWVPQPRTFAEFFVGRNAATLYGALWAAVAFVLLIACANLANLLLARAIGRSREMSVRIALGAGRSQIVRQLLTESFMLSAMGGAGGWWIAAIGVRVYAARANPPTLSWSDHLLDYALDARVLAYLIAISIATAVLFGLAPAWRLSAVDVNGALKTGGAAAGSTRGRRVSRLLVASEAALAVVLLAAAGVMIRSFLKISTADLGIDPTNITAMLVSLPDARYPRASAEIDFFDRLRTRIAATAGVESAAIASAVPAAGSKRAPYALAGAAPLDEQRRPILSTITIGPAYFRTVGAAVLSGRDFDDFDDASRLPAAIVNQAFANSAWPGERPLGKRFRLFDGKTAGAWLTVVGVAGNIVQNDPGRQTVDPLVYLPYRQQPARAMWVLIRTPLPAARLAPALRRELQMLDPDLPIWLGPFSLRDRLAGMGTYWTIGNNAALFMLFAAIGLLLAAIGLSAIVADSVTQRTREIGIRIAIGATPRDILGLVFGDGTWALTVGLAIGLAGALAVNRVLKSALVNVSPTDPATLVLACAILLLAAAFGCIVPARRALRIDPIVALRHE
jgi:putative ABC transport system permease protein